MSEPQRDDRLTDTASEEYAERLVALQRAWWKRALNVQAPYRWNLRRLELGRVLDIGCGIGRNLAALQGNGVGVDHNKGCVDVARSLGLTAYEPDDFHRSADARPGAYDSLLIAHVLEHLDQDAADSMLNEYLPYLRPAGRVAMITPQERGFASDASHVRFADFADLRRQAQRSGLTEERAYSFPFPRALGKLFVYNEFVFVAVSPGAS